MSQKYTQLTLDERSEIQALLQSGCSRRAIAKLLKRCPSSIGREIRRNRCANGYRCVMANQQAEWRRKTARKSHKIKGELERLIRKYLRKNFSPEQISGCLKLNHALQISCTHIYAYVHEDRAQGGSLYKHLRRGGRRYKKRKAKEAGRSLIPNRIDISERPAIVDLKEELGHWEGDTVIGVHHQGALVTLVERVSKYTLIGRVPRKTAQRVRESIEQLLGPLSRYALSATLDNGMEFSEHEQFARALGMDVYFARPYHSWQRGLNENTNGLIRQYFPKGTNFRRVSNSEVQRVQEALNDRPRKTLGFRTPRQVLLEHGVSGILKSAQSRGFSHAQARA